MPLKPIALGSDARRTGEMLAALSTLLRLDHLTQGAGQLLDFLLDFSGSDYGFIASLDTPPQGFGLRFLALSGAPLRDGCPDIANPVARRLLEALQPEQQRQKLLRGDHHFQQHRPDPLGEAGGQPDIHTQLSLPLRHDGQLLGIISLANGRMRDPSPLISELQALLNGCAWLLHQSYCKTTLASTDQHLNALRGNQEKSTQALQAQVRQLDQEQQFHRTLFNASPIGFSLHALDGELVDCNQSYCRLLARSKEALLGTPHARLVSPDTRGADLRRQHLLRQNGQHGALELSYLAPNGNPIPVRLRGQVVERSGQRLILSSVEDIGEQHRRNSALELLSQGVNTTGDEQLLNGFCRELCRLLQVDFAAIWRHRADGGPPHCIASHTSSSEAPNCLPETSISEYSGELHLRCASCGDARHGHAFQPLNDGEQRLLGCIGVSHRSALPLSPQEVDAVLRLFAVRVAAEIQRLEAERRFRDMFEFSSDAILLVDESGTIREINSQAPALLGYPHQELIGLGIEQLVPPPRRAGHSHKRAAFHTAAQPRPMAAGRLNIEALRKDGSTLPVDISLVPVQTGQQQWIAATIRDVSERQAAEDHLRQSLQDKEVLLKEVHHRVKNNLQIVVSLLNLQAEQIDNSDARRALQDCQNRVRAMALIHERLYRSEHFSGVHFGDYLASLVSILHRSLADPQYPVEVLVDAEDIPLDIDTAIPCGLIVNELITNSFKHALGKGLGQRLQVALRRTNDNVCLSVHDDGPGYPVSLRLESVETLGLTMVHTLARQLRAHIEMGGGPGARLSLQFAPTHSPTTAPAAPANQ